MEALERRHGIGGRPGAHRDLAGAGQGKRGQDSMPMLIVDSRED